MNSTKMGIPKHEDCNHRQRRRRRLFRRPADGQRTGRHLRCAGRAPRSDAEKRLEGIECARRPAFTRSEGYQRHHDCRAGRRHHDRRQAVGYRGSRCDRQTDDRREHGRRIVSERRGRRRYAAADSGQGACDGRRRQHRGADRRTWRHPPQWQYGEPVLRRARRQTLSQVPGIAGGLQDCQRSVRSRHRYQQDHLGKIRPPGYTFGPDRADADADRTDPGRRRYAGADAAGDGRSGDDRKSQGREIR